MDSRPGKLLVSKDRRTYVQEDIRSILDIMESIVYNCRKILEIYIPPMIEFKMSNPTSDISKKASDLADEMNEL